MADYEITDTAVAYDGKLLRLIVDEVLYTGTSHASTREVVVKDDFVMVVPVTEEGQVVCVERIRHPFKDRAISFPVGRVEDGESPEQAARRELAEEAGLRAGMLVKIAEIHESPEYARSVGHVYCAESSKPVGDAMEVLRFDEPELRRFVRTGRIRSATVVAALHHFLDYRGRSRLSQKSYMTTKSVSNCPFQAMPLPSAAGAAAWSVTMLAASLVGLVVGVRIARTAI